MVTLAGPSDIVEDLNVMIAAGLRFATILIDPPWAFKVYSDKGKGRSAERHYNTMTLEAIKALPIAAVAALDCALLCWSTWPFLPHALDSINRWGFTYKTDGFTWVKTNPKSGTLATGLGFWTRSNTEPCLLATRGHPKRLARDVHQVIIAARGRHSEKPIEMHARIERLVAGPYLEIFARRHVPGWICLGDQMPLAEAKPWPARRAAPAIVVARNVRAHS
jgi:N6-adenosine-specific RNA methylase IME4